MNKKKWAIALTLGYVIAYLFSNGPGILLINRAVLVWGVPPLYLWAVFWGTVQVGILIAAYFLVWSVGEAPEPKESET